MQLRKNKIFSLAAAFILFMLAILLISNVFSYQHKNSTAPIATLVKPCHQQKSSTNHTQKICQSTLQFYSILPDEFNYSTSTSEKFLLLFILGLLSMSPISSIFKPPKFIPSSSLSI